MHKLPIPATAIPKQVPGTILSRQFVCQQPLSSAGLFPSTRCQLASMPESTLEHISFTSIDVAKGIDLKHTLEQSQDAWGMQYLGNTGIFLREIGILLAYFLSCLRCGSFDSERLKP